MPSGFPGSSPKLKCALCAKQFKIQPRQIKDRLYCSMICKGIASRKRITKSCAACNKPITKRGSDWSNRIVKNNFCSKACAGNWKSATSTRRYRSLSCEICGYTRAIDLAHIVPAKLGGNLHYDNILALCPNHHRLFDRYLLTNEEEAKIIDRFIYAWSSPHTVCFPADNYQFSKEGQKKLNQYPLEFLLGLPDAAKWDLKNVRPFRVSPPESSHLEEHAETDEGLQDV